MNLAGIAGPALGSLLLPIVGAPVVFLLNALAFLGAAWMVSRVYQAQRQPDPHLEHFLESFASAFRYVRYTPGMQVILTRDFLFGLFIAAVPALMPVVALRAMHSGEQELVVRHSLPANRMTTPLAFGGFPKRFEAGSAETETEKKSGDDRAVDSLVQNDQASGNGLPV
jgi:hypothetical protein